MECNFRSSYLLPRRPSLLLRDFRFPPKLILSGRNLVNRFVIKSACGFGENGSFNGPSFPPNKVCMEEETGAEYGEGFETFRNYIVTGFLKDRLQEGFLQKVRHAMKPDEAYGLIFSWDNPAFVLPSIP